MTRLLIRLFVKNPEDTHNVTVRERYGKLAGVVGICSNLLLFVLKITVGLLTGSIAITADAVNNLSDCASSVITLAGFKLSGMPADEQHPYGHARFEYISGLVVSFLIMVIGLQFFTTSVGKIIRPEPVLFSAVVAVVLALTIAIKLWQGMFNKAVGTRIGSAALAATATDSINDVITTGVVLLGATVAQLTGWNLDGYLGLLVALFILYSGVSLVRETLNPLLGTAPDRELVESIQQRILQYPSVLGIHDLMVHNYGPERCFASVHVEVPANQDIMVSHDIIDNIERDFQVEMNINLVIHLDPIVTDDEKLSDMRKMVTAEIAALDPDLSMHDFRMVEGKSHTNLIFDVVAPPRYHLNDTALRFEIEKRVRERNPKCYCVITVDRSYISTKTRYPR